MAHRVAFLAVAATALPLLPVPQISVAPPRTWPPLGAAACGGTGASFCGDVRARLFVASAGATEAQIFWRRRDPTPELKSVILTDAVGNAVPSTSVVEATCGVVSFTAPAPGTFFAYYLPFTQASGGAGTTFSWTGCNNTAYAESNPCVLGRRLEGAPTVCATATAAAGVVVGIENRDDFNAFTVMEQMAAPAEMAAAVAALLSTPGGFPFVGVFCEDRVHSIRVFDRTNVIVRWTPGGAGPQPYAPNGPSFVGSGAPGEFVPLQLGLWAYAGAVANLTATAGTGLTGPGGVVIPPAAIRFINLAGVDIEGQAYARPYSLSVGEMGSLWVGVHVPEGAQSGAYSGTFSLSSAGSPVPGSISTIAVQITLNIAGQPVPFDGAANVASLSRLAWLDSTRGLEDTVPTPFVTVSAVGGGTGGVPLVLSSLLKTLRVSPDGHLASVLASMPSVRHGKQETSTNELLAAPITFEVYGMGGSAPLPSVVASPAAVSALTNSSVSWAAASTIAMADGSGSSITLSTLGAFDFTSYANFAVTLSNPSSTAAALGDVRVRVPVSQKMGAYIVGMSDAGAEATEYVDRQWRWSNTTGSNKVWVGRAEGGVLLNLKGEGVAWDSPMFGADYPVVPFVPPTWGGTDALPSGNVNGVNITAATVLAFTGPRTLAPGESVTFLFDLALTPSKTVNWERHWSTRAFQVGYGTPYYSPQQMKEAGVSTVTLHQGTPGIINGSLVNPWINYPFLNDTVPLLSNYSQQANELGMLVRFYYTIRELSSRAVETYAFLAQKGEILLYQDPYVIVQPGYAHAWNTHGGSAYLHQHVVNNYGACWQQTESNGEWDPSLCSIGTSRLFNYYVESLYWGMTQAPFMNGNYYDGTNFARSSMMRIRRAVDAGAAARGLGLPALLDLHTGREGTPDACSYATHYPLMDSIWNGEGFDFNGSPAYWLVEVSSRIHGLSGDMLGAGVESAFKGMLFGMTTRNSGWAPAMWAFWDAANISGTSVYGWWDVETPPVAVVNWTCGSPPSPGTCDWAITTNGYYDGLPCGQPEGNLACFTGLTLTAVEEQCCNNTALCAGFSFDKTDGSGCFKNAKGCFVSSSTEGYEKPGFVPPTSGRALATTYSTYGSHAIIAIASWCTHAGAVTLAVDLASLGLDASRLSITAPAIAGVQEASGPYASAEGPFPLTAGGGMLLVLQAT